jgi:hypothetical protein
VSLRVLCSSDGKEPGRSELDRVCSNGETERPILRKRKTQGGHFFSSVPVTLANFFYLIFGCGTGFSHGDPNPLPDRNFRQKDPDSIRLGFVPSTNSSKVYMLAVIS